MLFGRSLQLVDVEATELFVGAADAPLQIVRVTYTGGKEPAQVRIDGRRVHTPAPVLVEPVAGEATAEVAVWVAEARPGETLPATAVAGRARQDFDLVVAEPGWTMHMVNHFHYDPVWWNTQGPFTSTWQSPPTPARQMHSFALVRAHLDLARREPAYKFVLAEVDYLKPYWDVHPEDRAELRELMAAGRLEIMGGAYNEPNTNLTSPETTIRNFVHGTAFQRDVLGGDPMTAWQLDVFGHDPQFPGMAADAGLTSSSWARGPYHQWGPMRGRLGDPTIMQFRSEFDWISPSGRGLLTSYMPDHYSSGWDTDAAPDLERAEAAAYTTFRQLRKGGITRNVLYPVGTDHTPPNKWITAIHADWNDRYTWPRFVCSLPRDYFDAVRTELAERGLEPSPQTRDMNPIYTGKDVSYIDTKQANRAAEHAVLDAERFAVFACLLGGAAYPQAALAKAWVQLAFGAHHDAITGSEGDQVYLDLLTSWRDAWQLGTDARDAALRVLTGVIDTSGPGTPVVVWNPLTRERSDLVTVRLPDPVGDVRVVDAGGVDHPALVEHGGRSVTFLAPDVGSLGWRTFRLEPHGDTSTDSSTSGWQPMQVDGVPPNTIANDHYRLEVDPERGGGVRSLVELATGYELIVDGRVGNELVVYDEYPQHPLFGEGPWHLLPKGPPTVVSAAAPARVSALTSPIGERLVVRGAVGPASYTQTITLWRGVPRVDCVTTIDEFTGADRLLRVRWPCQVPGALPVSEVGDAVIGRGFGVVDVDSGLAPWTLDNPAFTWFGLSATARVRVGDTVRAVGVAEVVAPSEDTTGPLGRDLMVALVRAGVTGTCSWPQRPRYGHLTVDSNLPDFRVALGSPEQNTFTAAVLAAADPAYADEVGARLRANGRALVWVPAAKPLVESWVPGADLRDVRALPVLVIAGADDRSLRAAIAHVVEDLGDAEIVVEQRSPAGPDPAFADRTVALLNRGVPGFAVDAEGTLHASLMRSCTGWPSGVWIDPPRRTAPDGSNFQLQRWTHRFEYALCSGAGDWRRAGITSASADFSNPLVAVLARAQAGRLPGHGSLLRVEPAGSVAVGALKAAGNPLARGSAEPAEPAASLAIRLVELHGRDTEVVVDTPLGALTEQHAADLLERPLARVDGSSQGQVRLPLGGFQIATVLAVPDLTERPAATGEADVRLAPEAEAAQPLYARYWLHNRGPAPLGGLPAAPHVHPHRLALAPAEVGSPFALRLTVASDRTDEDGELAGTVTVSCPPGWRVTPDELPLRIPAGGHAETQLTVWPPERPEPGVYPIRALLALTGSARLGLPESWRQPVEDVCLVTVPGEPAGDVLRLVTGPEPVTLRAGKRGRLEVTVATDAQLDLAVEAHLISPWGTWEWAGPAAVGATLPARGQADLGFDLEPPPWADAGQWWALVRVAAAGELRYSPAVLVQVDR